MAYTKTLLQMRTRVRKLADCVGDTATGRHTTTQLNTIISESWQAMRAVVSKKSHLYLKPSSSTFTAGKTSPYSWGELSLPATCARLYGFDVTVTSTDIRTLLPISFNERNDYIGLYGQGTGIPAGYFVYNIGVEATTTVTAGKVGILPAPAAAYAYTLWYLPSWTAITDDTYVFDGVEGWDDWVAWDCVMKLASADNDMQQTAQIAATEREKAEARLISGGSDFQQGGPVRRIDTAAMRRRNLIDVYARRP